ncbi:MAG: sugar phosphate isomerase/epimerase family protein [Promethearchaeota archaeon]
MQLGISSLGFIIEKGLSNKFSNIFDLLFSSTEACLLYAEQNSIKLVELVIDPSDILGDKKKHRFIELINSFSLDKQVHGPFVDVNLCSHNTIISEASIKSYIKTAHFCEEIKVKMMTIHPGLANYLIDAIRNYNKLQLKKAVNKLLDITSSMDIILCLENMPKNTYIMLDEKNIEEIFNIINHEKLFLTYDTSHFYTNRGNVKLLWEKFHNKIKNVHLVENFTRISDTHPPLGTGKIKFNEIFEIIRGFNYRGPMIIELSSAKALEKSINFIKKFL